MTDKSNVRPHAVVTGASSGIGQAFAQRLSRDGFDLTIVARRRDRLEALAKRLQDADHVQVEVVVADLTKAADLRALEKRVSEYDLLELLVNNAGFGGYMPFVQLDADQAEELIDLQVLAVTRLTRAALPGMINRKKGAIINVSSRLAFSGAAKAEWLPKRATYAAAKAYMNTFTQILNAELNGTGVQVQVLCPGVVLTEFHVRMGMDPSRFPPEIIMPAADVVQASLAGLRLGEAICVPNLGDTTLLMAVNEAQDRLLEASPTGAVASRYK
jgi:short-subunit dehydrogenase